MQLKDSMRFLLSSSGLVLMSALWATPVSADIASVGGSVALREPPGSILLNEWESDDEIRVWFEREATLVSDLPPLGHSNPGFVNDASQVVNGTVLSGTTVQSYMVREDPIGTGPILLDGFITFDTPIILVIVGSQIEATDGIFGRTGVVYNGNSFRGLELDSSTPEADAFEISADRLRIDLTMDVGEWTDDIRIITAIPEPSCAVILALGGCFVLARRRH